MRGYGESEVLRGVHNYAMKKLVGKKGSFLISYYVLHHVLCKELILNSTLQVLKSHFQKKTNHGFCL